jgi:hypothetical protein
VAYRFRIETELAASICLDARVAARAIQDVLERIERYRLITRELAERGTGVPADRRLEGVMRAQESQLSSFLDDVRRLAREAEDQGPDSLKRVIDPPLKPERLLTTPASSDLARIAVLPHVMTTVLAHSMREAADRLANLTRRMSTSTDPGLLVLASQLEDLEHQLRPAGMPPGPSLRPR